MKVALLLFILGVSLIILGYSRQISEDTCQSEVVVKYVPRNIYDSLMKDSNISV